MNLCVHTHVLTLVRMCAYVHMLLLFEKNRNGELRISGGLGAIKTFCSVSIYYIVLQTFINECPNACIDAMALTQRSCWGEKIKQG